MISIKTLKTIEETIGRYHELTIEIAEENDEHNNILQLDIEITLPLLHNFETRLFCNHLSKEYEELSVILDYESKAEITVTNDSFNTDVFDTFLLELHCVDSYSDVSDLEGYYEEREELRQEDIMGGGLSDFLDNLKLHVLRHYPIMKLDLSDYDDIEISWVLSMFEELLEEDYIEGDYMSDHFVFEHKFVGNEDYIFNMLAEHTDLNFECENEVFPLDDTLLFNDTIIYKIMGVSDFTINQVASIIWLQNENKEWAKHNLVFISGYGYYLHINKYTYAVIDRLKSGQCLNSESVKKLAIKLSKTDVSWWSNWQAVVRALINVAGLEEFKNHYSHSDKYDYAARMLFQHFIKYYPELAELNNNNWWSLKEAKILPDNDLMSFDRHNKGITEYSIKFDFKAALKHQIETFPTVIDGIKYQVKRLFVEWENKNKK